MRTAVIILAVLAFVVGFLKIAVGGWFLVHPPVTYSYEKCRGDANAYRPVCEADCRAANRRGDCAAHCERVQERDLHSCDDFEMRWGPSSRSQTQPMIGAPPRLERWSR